MFQIIRFAGFQSGQEKACRLLRHASAAIAKIMGDEIAGISQSPTALAQQGLVPVLELSVLGAMIRSRAKDWPHQPAVRAC
ncbi:hypothetical protein [Bosea sp. BIWAKO-01]|uniref:hypothetical protein n=1 Tax=Bosea sp. BIWAKO-01 TaxID=506668 RepID=UPI00114C8F91|nr:hypothetical protein [Bosea sp. BIWAKO-01]